jgi:hypothetical protein
MDYPGATLQASLRAVRPRPDNERPGTNAPLRFVRSVPTMPDMKRFAAAVIWFYAGWTAGALIDFVAGLSGLTIGPVLGIVLGTAAAALIAGDPRRLIWSRPTTSAAPQPA